ncbi:hypothetical protein Bca52824_011175 [Brassica carinata]|uniref:Uncharacterized protein n=1 Tax=Brassica carinata TaxID=52824 RepID=A0A8X8BBF0_BRACI|nr:hypothetical protein Bca52824_011175 [Brassica carinata]
MESPSFLNNLLFFIVRPILAISFVVCFIALCILFSNFLSCLISFRFFFFFNLNIA